MFALLLFTCQDPRFKDEVDRMLGATTNSLLCVPVLNADSDVIAVAQVINKHGTEICFTKDDEKVRIISEY